jgi:hypothetical protein
VPHRADRAAAIAAFSLSGASVPGTNQRAAHAASGQSSRGAADGDGAERFPTLRLAAGRSTWEARSGQHDDLVLAVGIAAWWAARPPPPRECSARRGLQESRRSILTHQLINLSSIQTMVKKLDKPQGRFRLHDDTTWPIIGRWVRSLPTGAVWDKLKASRDDVVGLAVGVRASAGSCRQAAVTPMRASLSGASTTEGGASDYARQGRD